MLCHHVCWVVGAQYLNKVNGSGSDFLLNPQVCDIEMSELAHPTTSAHADRGSRVRMDADIHLEAEIASDRLQAEALRDAHADAVQLGFA